MSEENIEKLIAMIKEEAYIPGDWVGVYEIEQLRNIK